MMKRASVLACLVAGLAFVSMPGAAVAGPKHCPPGHAKKGWCESGTKSTLGRTTERTRKRDRDDDRDYDREREYERQDAIDRAYEEGFSDGRDYEYRIGERLDRDRYRVLDRDRYYDRYGRQLDDGYYYAEADGKQLLIEAATNTIIDILSR